MTILQFTRAQRCRNERLARLVIALGAIAALYVAVPVR